MNRRSPFSYIPGFANNAVLQVVIINGIAFATIQLIRIVMLVMTSKVEGLNLYETHIVASLALGDVHALPLKIYTLLSYGWFHNGFWELFSNMLWFYLFASMVQMLIGHKQVIPIYIYSMIVGGIFYYLGQFINIPLFYGRPYILSPLASLTGVAAAAVTLSPDYRFYFADRFSLPILLVAGIFLLLCLLNIYAFPLMFFMILGGALSGFVYVKLLKKGYRPGAWMYDFSERLQTMVTPRTDAGWSKHARKRNDFISKFDGASKPSGENRIDAILDKINLKGYDALSKEEKEYLQKAGK
jgi:membrane associated rhomboid family serine protease